MATYKDIDLSFKMHPVSGDILTKVDVNAVKQALKNLFRSSNYDFPFQTGIGLGLDSHLFENLTPVTSAIIERKIKNQIFEFEPRCVIDNIVVSQEENSINIEFLFHVIGLSGQQSLNYTLERTR